MPKKTVIWSKEARADLRAIDRETALRILRSIDSYLTTGAGDVKKLQPPRHEFFHGPLPGQDRLLPLLRLPHVRRRGRLL
jgi:hypothetical protein